MNIWKKAASVSLSATLLASLLMTVFVGTVSATFVDGATSAATYTYIAAGATTAVTPATMTTGAATDSWLVGKTVIITASSGYTIAALTTANGAGGCTANTLSALPATSVTITAAAAGCTAGTTVTLAGLTVTAAAGATTGTLSISGGDSVYGVAGIGTVLANITTVPRIAWTFVPATVGAPADGVSTVQLTAQTAGPAASLATISISGGKIVASNLAGTEVIAANGLSVTTDTQLVATNTITIQAPTTAGNVTVTESYAPIAGGIAITDTAATVPFYAASNLAVSAANSSVKFVAAASACSAAALTTLSSDKAGNAAKLCVTVKDGNASTISGATVSVTSTPVGLLAGGTEGAGAIAGTAQATSDTADTSGVYAFGLTGSNLTGTATISISVTYSSATTTLASQSWTFTGPVATVTASNNKYSLLKSGGAVTDVVRFTAKDASGNAVATTLSSVVVSDATIFTAVVANEFDGALVKGKVTVTCTGVEGSGTVTVKSNSMSSAAIKVYCSGALDTYTVAFDKITVAPGGTATLTYTAKDAAGQPAPDTSATPDATAISSGAITAWGAIANGVSTATFLAPFNTGTVTALVSNSTAATTVSATASINVSTPVVISAASAATALGATKTGPFTTATKVAAHGAYITVKMSFGASAAGANVGIWGASKNSAGVWSAFTLKTNRTADASGNVYYWFRSYSAAWLSFQGRTDAGVRAPARQVRWN